MSVLPVAVSSALEEAPRSMHDGPRAEVDQRLADGDEAFADYVGQWLVTAMLGPNRCPLDVMHQRRDTEPMDVAPAP